VSQNIGFTTQGAVAFVKALNVPAGWTVTVSPLSGNAGTFTVTAPNVTAPGGEALVLAADAGGKSVMRTLSLQPLIPPSAAASTQTWTFGASTLVWSDAIQMPDCNKGDFYGGNDEVPWSDGRSYTEDGYTWYYYSWAYVDNHKSTMCPSPWRVPAKADFEELLDNAGADALTAAWGLPGYASGSNMADVGLMAFYWSSTVRDAYYAYHMRFDPSDAVTGYSRKYFGLQVRCVQ
ncbi:MAG: hypothetical protein LBN98_01605, partial [Prevotellaceae bacterium]|nr:hypothetical protein [Prevotellaceae bacterium]